MAKYIVEGGNRLYGEVRISGNKNAVLPAIAASLLTADEVVLRNVPYIADVLVMIEILQALGASTSFSDHKLTIKAQKLINHKLPEDLTSKLRASILLAGPLLARLGKVEFSHPGGDVIGKRSIQTHTEGFRALGYKISSNDRSYFGKKGGGSDCEYFLNEASCTATENILLCASLSPSTLVLKNCPIEPQIIDLCNMLSQMGVVVEGTGTSTLTITGKKTLQGVDFSVSSDYIEMATYALAAAITGGKIKIHNISLKGLEPVIFPLKKFGVEFSENSDNTVDVTARRLTSIPKLVTNIWPGFPTDLMSLFIVLSTQSRGVSLLHDWMYESRMFFVDKLISMGANITIADPHRVFVYGPTKLYGREMETPDIRAGMALVLAALIAKGTSVINRAELIERGYEDVVGNLSRLGAKIERID